MINKRLLKKELDWYKTRNIGMKPIRYNKNLFPELFKKFNNYGMSEHFYCCHGLERSCWTEVIEEDIWSYTLAEVKIEILRNIKETRKYLYNNKNSGGNRIYIGEREGVVCVFIYLRDVIATDYSLWFEKVEHNEN